jgi:hypothetical protein
MASVAHQQFAKVVPYLFSGVNHVLFCGGKFLLSLRQAAARVLSAA